MGVKAIMNFHVASANFWRCKLFITVHNAWFA